MVVSVLSLHDARDRTVHITCIMTVNVHSEMCPNFNQQEDRPRLGEGETPFGMRDERLRLDRRDAKSDACRQRNRRVKLRCHLGIFHDLSTASTSSASLYRIGIIIIPTIAPISLR